MAEKRREDVWPRGAIRRIGCGQEDSNMRLLDPGTPNTYFIRTPAASTAEPITAIVPIVLLGIKLTPKTRGF
jgi:hypothetical protein